MRRALRTGLGNVFEHGLMRALDAASTFVLVAALAPEEFARLALAQAYCAPLLLILVSPSAILYRDLASWRSESEKLAGKRIAMLRVGGVAIFAGALTVAALLGTSNGTASAMVWAMSLHGGMQLLAVDREALRLSHGLKKLSLLTFLHKGGLLGWVAWVGFGFSGNTEQRLIALSAGGLVWLAFLYLLGRASSPIQPASRAPSFGESWAFTWHSLRDFNLWSHGAGVIQSTIQSLDLTFAGFFGVPANSIGLYAVVLKLSNLTLAVPNALVNTYAIQVSRAGTGSDDQLWRQKTLGYSGLLVLAMALQALVMIWLFPWMTETLARGRWGAQEQALQGQWGTWVLAGQALAAGGFLFTSYLSMRGRRVGGMRGLFFSYYLWLFSGAAIAYGVAVMAGTEEGALDRLALANVVVGGIQGFLPLALFLRESRSEHATRQDR